MLKCFLKILFLGIHDLLNVKLSNMLGVLTLIIPIIRYLVSCVVSVILR